jgi:hypothetical protein
MLVYTSRCLQPVTAEMLNDILTVSRDLNKRDEITGFLAVRSGFFLQLLEGPKEKVLACYQRIKMDSRHNSLILQGEAIIETRTMPNWSMGLVEIDENENAVIDLLHLFELAQTDGKFSDAKSLQTLLSLFAKKTKLIC